MNTTQRIFLCLGVGLITFIVLAIIGVSPNNMGKFIASAMGLTALISTKFRTDNE